MTSQTDGKLPSREGGGGEQPHYLTPTHRRVWKVLNAAEGYVKAHGCGWRLRVNSAMAAGSSSFRAQPASHLIQAHPALPAPSPRAQECVLPTGMQGPSPISSSKPTESDSSSTRLLGTQTIVRERRKGLVEAEKPLYLPAGLGSRPHAPVSAGTPTPREGGIRSLASNALPLVFIGLLIICPFLLTVSVLRGKNAADKGSNVTS